MPSRYASRAVLGLVVLAAALAGCGGPTAAPSAPGPSAAASGPVATASSQPLPPADPVSAHAQTSGESFSLDQVNHVIVIYQENWSFDGLYSQFPGARGYVDQAPVAQTDASGVPLQALPQPLDNTGQPDVRFPQTLPVHFYNLLAYIPPKDLTGDMIHAFYHEQAQIDGGANDRFVAYGTNPGLVLGFYDASILPEGQLAAQFVLCDNCFHSAFGGSFLNHQWLIAARTPEVPAGVALPESWRGRFSTDPARLEDRPLSTDGRWMVNTFQTLNDPHGSGPAIPALYRHATIGDRLSAAGISWAWYAGGWDHAVATKTAYQEPDDFQPHHQPFNYFAAFDQSTAAGQANRAAHLKDEQDFLAALAGDAHGVPGVAFIKPMGTDNEHPGYAALARGQRHTADLVDAIRQSPIWKDSVIIITYDEHGGRWDHVAPPVIDQWGPGVRIPMIIISPFAKTHAVDHTRYETVSILAFIEKRWGLQALSTRDAQADPLSGAFH